MQVFKLLAGKTSKFSGIVLEIIRENVNVRKFSYFLPHRVECPVTSGNLIG